MVLTVAVGFRVFSTGTGQHESNAAPHGKTPAAQAHAEPRDESPKAPEETFAPPAHSIAALPFVNMSGDPNEDYFSDGLCEEPLNSLSRVSELQVAARTSRSAMLQSSRKSSEGSISHARQPHAVPKLANIRFQPVWSSEHLARDWPRVRSGQ